jgi:hypothetical protein
MIVQLLQLAAGLHWPQQLLSMLLDALGESEAAASAEHLIQ